MSDGWQVGDLALCFQKDKFANTDFNGWEPKIGGIYRVIEVEFFVEGDVALNFAEDTHYIENGGFAAYCFRKIKPDTEPCEEEFTVLIKRGRKVQA